MMLELLYNLKSLLGDSKDPPVGATSLAIPKRTTVINLEISILF